MEPVRLGPALYSPGNLDRLLRRALADSASNLALPSGLHLYISPPHHQILVVGITTQNKK